MATITTPLTDKQIKALEPLWEASKSIKKEIDKIQKERQVDVGMDYDKNKNRQKKLDNLKEKLNGISKEIEEITNARQTFEDLKAECREKLTKAEEMKNMWGFSEERR